MSRKFISVVSVIAIAMFAMSASAQSNDWQWSVTPYVWWSDVGLEVNVDDDNVVDANAYAGNVIDELDMAILVNFQGQRGRNGFLVDLAMYDFDDDPVTTSGPIGNTFVASGDLEMTILDFGGIYNPRGDGMGFALIYGARMVDVDQELDVHVETPSGPTDEVRYEASETFWDGLIGVRWIMPISERLLLNAKADVSTGSTDLTWSALGGVGYSFGADNRYTMLAGYRYMEMQFDNDSIEGVNIENEVDLDGPYVAFQFGF